MYSLFNYLELYQVVIWQYDFIFTFCHLAQCLARNNSRWVLAELNCNFLNISDMTLTSIVLYILYSAFTPIISQPLHISIHVAFYYFTTFHTDGEGKVLKSDRCSRIVEWDLASALSDSLVCTLCCTTECSFSVFCRFPSPVSQNGCWHLLGLHTCPAAHHSSGTEALPWALYSFYLLE